MTTSLIVSQLKSLDEDYEWYPTTQRMIDLIKGDMIKYFCSEENLGYDHEKGEHRGYIKSLSRINVLDCGAGDGRVVKQLTNGGQAYAIEKSKTLIDAMAKDIYTVGTEFRESTLIDKKVDVVFCNPPYSEYIPWAQKIILEANSKMVYMILPSRWQGSSVLADALKTREASWEVIGTDDFLDAERSARAKVDIIAINLATENHHRDRLKTDPFDVWFETNFKVNAKKDDRTDYEKKEARAETLKDKVHKQVTAGRSLVPVLVELYNMEMEHLQKNFLNICKLDPDVLKELGVSTESIKGALKLRITGLKDKYWKELFLNYEKITKRLTHKSRKRLLERLTEHTNIDFTESNIYAVSVWVIKNANAYFDTQLIELVEKMVDQANVKLYKSNKRLYTDQDWRSGYMGTGCRRTPEDLRHFGLELRIVLHRHQAIVPRDPWSSWEYKNGLHETAHRFLDDIITVANNLGFELPYWMNSMQMGQWTSNKKKEFVIDHSLKTGKTRLLMQVRAFINGNIHIKFSQDFIRTLNIEFGRLKGWLTNHIQASDELDIPVKDAAKLFKANYHLGAGEGLVEIGFVKPEPEPNTETKFEPTEPENYQEADLFGRDAA